MEQVVPIEVDEDFVGRDQNLGGFSLTIQNLRVNTETKHQRGRDHLKRLILYS